MWTEQANHLYHKLHPLLDLCSLIRPCAKSFHVDGSFGDVYMQLSLLKEYSLHNTNYAVFISKRYLKLAELALGKKSKILPINSTWLRSFLMQHGVLGEVPGLPRPLLLTLYPVLPDLISRGQLNPITAYRAIINLEQAHQLESLISIESSLLIPQCIEILKRNNLTPGRTVVLCPYNNTFSEINPAMWVSLVESLNRLEYDVCINIAGQGSEFPEVVTKGNYAFIEVPAHLAVTFTKLCGYFVSGLNGFSTIQWLFNKEVRGFILINSLDGHTILPKNSMSYSYYHSLFHQDQFPHLDCCGIKELLFDPQTPEILLDLITEGIRKR